MIFGFFLHLDDFKLSGPVRSPLGFFAQRFVLCTIFITRNTLKKLCRQKLCTEQLQKMNEMLAITVSKCTQVNICAEIPPLATSGVQFLCYRKIKFDTLN